MAAIKSPASPTGILDIMKWGKMASVFCMVKFSSPGWIL